MARFCTNCGSPVSDTARFCPGCGSGVSASQPPAAAPAAKGSPLVKIVLIAFGVLAVLGAVVTAGLFYAGYRVKEKVEQVAKQEGIDLSSLGSSETGRSYDPCSLLPKEEAAQVLNTAIERVERQGDVCQFYTPAVSAEERQRQVSEALERLKKKSQETAATSEREGVRESGIQDLTKAIVGGANDGSAPYLTLTVHPDGKAMMAGMKLALMGLGGSRASEALKGVGDEAVLGPMDSILMFVKNGTGIELDLRQVAGSRETVAELGRRIAARM